MKSSLAETIYRSKVNQYAKPDEIRSFARSDCGGARLAALYVERLVSECAVETNDSEAKNLIACVIRKYPGMKDTSREYAIYALAVGKSYADLFDQTNDFYYAYLAAKMKIGAIRSGECITFNAGRSELAANPKDATTPLSYGGTQPGGVPEFLIIGDARIEYIKPPSKSDSSQIVKLVAPDKDTSLNGQADPSLSKARQQFIIRYACERYRPLAVEFFSRPDFVPSRFGKYCTGNSSDEPSEDSYVLLNTTGTLAAEDLQSTLCNETPAAPR